MQQKNLKAILFDFDGTLMDTIPLIVESYQYVYRKYCNREVSRAEIVAGIGLPLESIFAAEGEERAKELLTAYLDYNRPRLATGVGIYLGIGPMLEALAELDLALGIVTAKRGSDLAPTLEAFDLKKYFDVIVSKFDTTEHKPNPAPLNLAMEKLGLTKAEEILYIGDAVYDIQAAKNGGFASGLVAWSETAESTRESEQPDYFFKSPEEIVNYAKAAIAANFGKD
ncbi:MAG: HAD-IA family hydrolase [Eubacteriales bacterium]|nr:HAD-IA family hydrolase [Eubacteriales bacterium]